MDYWKKRTLQNEQYVANLATSYSKRQQRYYQQAYRQIAGELNRFYTAVENGDVSRTDLWNYVRYQNLMDSITQNCDRIGSYQLDIMDMLSRKVFEDTIGKTLDMFGKGNLFRTLNTEALMEQVLNSKWSGKNYSARVWDNKNQLASRLRNDIQAMILQGKSPNEIKHQIKQDFNTSYSVADRLIRTESSYVYNAAAVHSYQLGGCKEVEFLAESDACEICLGYNTKKYTIGSEPTLPIHPNCRCTYLPVIE